MQRSIQLAGNDAEYELNKECWLLEQLIDTFFIAESPDG